VEKNIGAFLGLNLPGTKIVVGDGPARFALQREFPDVVFLGRKSGHELAQIYASADVFVFPSLTDTFGLVMLEALAAGTPVAAFPVTGPREVLGKSGCGVVSLDLRQAALQALSIDRVACRTYASGFGIRESAVSFMSNICKALRRPDVFRPPFRSLIAAE
jgi:glycosyltransferase involved in cell wall biosynthesis